MNVRTVVCAALCAIGIGLGGLVAEDSATMVNAKLSQLKAEIPRRMLEDGLSIHESLNFDQFATNRAYRAFAASISNEWRTVLVDFRRLGTNETDRLAVLGVGKCFDENFFIAYCKSVADLQAKGMVSERELEWALASGRTDLDTCLLRRYAEPEVKSLVLKLKSAFPKNGGWDGILTGRAYTNYVEEVEAGVW